MAKLSVDQTNINDLLFTQKLTFLIPDYQRPYEWTEKECTTLWEDIISFAFPGGDTENFDKKDEYFLGPIVIFPNEKGQREVIDGQQRLTTILLLLRAFYDEFQSQSGTAPFKIREKIARCIWETDEFDDPIKNTLKISSEVATDNDKDEFLRLLQDGTITNNMKSTYAVNFRFFQSKIAEYMQQYAHCCFDLPLRILGNCILLPIEADSQETALRIFSTLNDRGLPLSDSDIFKAKFYKHYSNKGTKNEFIKEWKELEEKATDIFHPQKGTPMDELFTKYMYFLRAKTGIKTSTVEGLRNFYEKNNYERLNDDTFQNLKSLASFWENIVYQNEEIFTKTVLNKFFILNYAPNNMWSYIVSVYYMQNKNKDGSIDNNKLEAFLDKITAFIFAYTIVRPGVNSLRAPIFAEMINIVNNKKVTFADYRFAGKADLRNRFNYYTFSNSRAITKSILTWWAFQNPEQKYLKLSDKLEIEHIYAKKRNQLNPLSNSSLLETLGNKSLLEKTINISVNAYMFNDKKKYYLGNIAGKNETKICELKDLANQKRDFKEKDIKNRTNQIIEAFIEYLDKEKLIETL